MSTIKGVFQPFKKYVTDQLKLRKQIVGNPINIDNPFYYPHLDEDNIDNDPSNPYKIDTNSLKRHPSFYSYTTQKQCVIKMVSGVDILQSSDGYTNILETEGFESMTRHDYFPDMEGNKNSLQQYDNDENPIPAIRKNLLEGSGLAKAYALGNNMDDKGYFYGNPAWRSDASDGFGMVPPPGITDATIDTKSQDGSLREATVNFVCHNRRQLEVLEALYMRPGYPLLLEWGWSPYVYGTYEENNTKASNVEIEKDEYSIMDEFLDSNQDLDTLNFKIKSYKEITGGNYDGFIGFCKNFEFKIREDGGYDCSTQIIAHGEILESLRQKIIMVPVTPTQDDYTTGNSETKQTALKTLSKEREPIDIFLYLLRSIRFALDKAGNRKFIELSDTKYEIRNRANTDADALKQYGIDLSSAWGSDLELQYKATALGGSLLAYGMGWTWEKLQPHTNIEDGIEIWWTYQNEEGDTLSIADLNKIPGGQESKYIIGWHRIVNLVKKISKQTHEKIKSQVDGWRHIPVPLVGTKGGLDFDDGGWGHAKRNRNFHLGLDSMFEGTILKEFSLENPEEDEEGNKKTSGINKNIYVRWDLICQMLNQEVTAKYAEDHALVELTYLNEGEKSYKKGNYEEKEKYYFESERNDNLALGDKTVIQGEGEGKFPSEGPSSYITYATPKASNLYPSDWKVSRQNFKDWGDYKSLDNNIIPALIGRSYDNSICLMPHQILNMISINKEGETMAPNKQKEWWDQIAPRKTLPRNFTSFEDVESPDNSIGLVYFNLKYLINTYESFVLESYQVDSGGKEVTKRRLKKEFNFHDFITTIWNGVNEACGGYYDFGLHTEHERPNVARIVDFTFSGNSRDTGREIFTFDPQGLNSITRESNFSSKLDNDFASVISIAAQAPNDINSLESVSFKAFHKGIRSRFTERGWNKDDRDAMIDDAGLKYQSDLKEYEDMVKSLDYFVTRMNASNYETEIIEKDNDTEIHKTPMSPELAKRFANQLEEKRISLKSRYPEKDENGKENDGKNGQPFMGQYKDEASHYRNAIIPITTSMTLDGISGINPLNIFKVHPDKLPIGYQNENIVFIVKKETHKITSGQDWTTSITGYLTLLDDTPMEGYNPDNSDLSEEDLSEELNRLDDDCEVIYICEAALNAYWKDEAILNNTSVRNTHAIMYEANVCDGNGPYKGKGAEWNLNIMNTFDEDPCLRTGWGNPFSTMEGHAIMSPWPERAEEDWPKYGRFHTGLDLKCNSGDELLAPRDGIVEGLSYDNNSQSNPGGFGNVFIMKFDTPTYSNASVSEDTQWAPNSLVSNETHWNDIYSNWNPGSEYEHILLTKTSMMSDANELENYPISELQNPATKALYAHLRDAPLHKPGTHVYKGQVIGYCGSSGRSSGPHLHYEVGDGDFNTNGYWGIKGDSKCYGREPFDGPDRGMRNEVLDENTKYDEYGYPIYVSNNQRLGKEFDNWDKCNDAGGVMARCTGCNSQKRNRITGNLIDPTSVIDFTK
tara:strand:+ start:4377 stop:8876 length:4500 start_codon:yes stop_codon:yes gene_type:complete